MGPAIWSQNFLAKHIKNYFYCARGVETEGQCVEAEGNWDWDLFIGVGVNGVAKGGRGKSPQPKKVL